MEEMFLTARITWYASDDYSICFRSLITVIDWGRGRDLHITFVWEILVHIFFCLNAERFLGPQKKSMQKKEMDKLGYVKIRKLKL